MASRFFLFCLMLIVASMMSTSTIPVEAHRLLKRPNPTNTNHLFGKEMFPTILLPKLIEPELRKPKRGLLQIDIHPTFGAVP
ncbi:hypothetical protein SOVF_174860, partial [Spinacia oleracea]